MEVDKNAGNEVFEADMHMQPVSETLKPRKFLKRGEGIKKRFGIDPKDLRIDNLPPYEYLKNNGKCKTNSRTNESRIHENPKLSSTPRTQVDQELSVCPPHIIDKRQIPLGWAKDFVDDCMASITPIKILNDCLHYEYTEIRSQTQTEQLVDEDQRDGNETEMLNSKPNLVVRFEEDTLKKSSYQQEQSKSQNFELEPELYEQLQEIENVMESSNVYEYFNNALLSELQKRIGGINITAAKEETVESAESLVQISNEDNFDLSENAEEIRNHLAMLKQNLDIFKKDHKKLLELQREFILKSKRVDKEHKIAMKKLEEERMQFEIYMHDEKLKAEKEAKKTNDQAKQKMQKQMTELKKEITELQSQLQHKEKTFVATEARLRAQTRNWQKERIQLQEQNKELKSIILQIVQQNATTPLNKKMTNQLSTHKFEKNLNLSLIMPNESSRLQKKEPNEPEVEQQQDMSMNVSAETTPKRSSAGHWQLKKVEESKSSNNLTVFQRQVVNEDGSKNIYYTNGNRKEISADEMLVRMLYFNGDIKETNINAGSIKYYYATQNVWHTTYLDGLEIIEFPNGQIEHRHKDGKIEVHFPNDSVQIINPSSSKTSEEWQFPNGSKLQIQRNGDRILLLPNGQKEEQTKMGKRRVFPDGTVKLVYPDGSQETRYSNGRIRIKDKYGQLIMDSNQEFESA